MSTDMTPKAHLELTNHANRWRQVMVAFVVGLLAAQSMGCCSTSSCNQPGALIGGVLDQQISCFRDKVWAKRAFNLRYANCDREFRKHFEAGFVDGYCNVCGGEEGYVPAMPPKCYWGNEFQCAEGAQCVNAWFEGYPAGVQAAKKDGAGSFHDVYISNMINAAITQKKATEQVNNEKVRTATTEIQPEDQPTEPLVPQAPPAPTNDIPPLAKSAQLVPIMEGNGMPMPMSVKPTSFDDRRRY